jgi:hypothetical protein
VGLLELIVCKSDLQDIEDQVGVNIFLWRKEGSEIEQQRAHVLFVTCVASEGCLLMACVYRKIRSDRLFLNGPPIDRAINTFNEEVELLGISSRTGHARSLSGERSPRPTFGHRLTLSCPTGCGAGARLSG